jgi:hypothetical protein
MSNECQELKNIKYKTMLLNGNQKKLNSVINNISNLDILLDNETKKNKEESWNKLDKSAKMEKITQYIETIAITHKLNIEEKDELKKYLSTILDKKSLQRNKDVIYKKESGVLESIPTLQFNNSTRKFTLRQKHQQSVLKNLGPTRKNKMAVRAVSPENTNKT